VGNAKIILFLILFSAFTVDSVIAEPDYAVSLSLRLDTTSDWTLIQITGIGDIRLIDNTETPQKHNLTITTKKSYLSIWVGKPQYCEELTNVEIELVTINPETLHFNISKGYIGYTNLSILAWTGIEYQEITHISHRNTKGDPSHNRYTVTTNPEPYKIQLRKIRNRQKEALAIYYPWYGAPDDQGIGRHWGKEFSESLNTPLLGAYDSHNESLITKHIKLAVEHGVTGFASSWWGVETYEDHAFQIILDNSYGLKTCVYYETNRDTTLSTIEIANELNYVIRKYGPHHNYLRYSDKPVIFVFNADGYGRDTGFWENVTSLIDDCILVGDFRDPALVSVFDGVHIYNEFDLMAHKRITSWISLQNMMLPHTIREFNQQSRNRFIICEDKLTIGTVSPGYDDTRHRVNGTTVPRDGNETYQGYWKSIHSSEIDWVIITSWNEWHEATEIEPSLEYGYDALQETRIQIEKFMRN
jgi:hypothetical protein